jgi:hypothetical protein
MALAACEEAIPARSSAPSGPTSLAFTTDDGTRLLHVELADTPALRARGLMGREHLDPDAGMAFLFGSPVESRFWMKDTLIPLSIAFWDEEGTIVAIREMEPCREEPCRTYGAPEPYVGAAEANAGWFAENGVAVGDRVELRSPR